MKNWIIGILVVVVLVMGWYIIWGGAPKDDVVSQGNTEETQGAGETATTTPGTQLNKGEELLGKSAEGRDILAYHYGAGADEVLFIGGIHGGYEWNTSLLAYKLMDYLKTNPDAIAKNLKVTVIPVMNPDGLFKVVGTTTDQYSKDNVATSVAVQTAGRFNGNTVDLGRNFDCEWQATGMWQNKKVSGGNVPFSEPESMAVKNYVQANNPKAVVVYYSAAGGVYSSACGAGIPVETKDLTSLYAKASGYKAYDKFDAYALSGDMVNWFAKINVPAVSVLLTDHTNIELDKNLAGLKAVLQKYAK